MQTHTPKTNSEIRKAVKYIYGSKNAIVKQNGEVRVRLRMPNSNVYGWHLLGFTGQIELEDKIWWPDGTLKTKF